MPGIGPGLHAPEACVLPVYYIPMKNGVGACRAYYRHTPPRLSLDFLRYINYIICKKKRRTPARCQNMAGTATLAFTTDGGSYGCSFGSNDLVNPSQKSGFHLSCGSHKVFRQMS